MVSRSHVGVQSRSAADGGIAVPRGALGGQQLAGMTALCMIHQTDMFNLHCVQKKTH